MKGSNSVISLITLSRSRSCRASGGRTNGSGSTRAVDDLHDELLRRRGELFVARLGNRNRVEFQTQPVIQAVLRPVKLPVPQTGQLDRTPHVARVRNRSSEVIHALVPPRNQRRGDQRHAARNKIDGNQIEALVRVAGKLAEKSPQQIGKRRGSIDAFIPAEKRLLDGRLHDGRAAPRRSPRCGDSSRKFRISDSARLFVSV